MHNRMLRILQWTEDEMDKTTREVVDANFDALSDLAILDRLSIPDLMNKILLEDIERQGVDITEILEEIGWRRTAEGIRPT